MPLHHNDVNDINDVNDMDDINDTNVPLKFILDVSSKLLSILWKLPPPEPRLQPDSSPQSDARDRTRVFVRMPKIKASSSSVQNGPFFHGTCRSIRFLSIPAAQEKSSSERSFVASARL